MSGIFLFYNPFGVPEATRQVFNSNLADRVSRMPNQKVDVLRGSAIHGAASHHGLLATGGIASDETSDLLATGSCWINHQDERLAKPEQILAAFNSQQTSHRTPFKGSFALAFCDRVKNELTVESDRWSVYPVYYRQLDKGIAVSTSIKFLTGFGNEKINRDGVAEFLHMGYMARPQTFVEDIHLLPADSRLVFGKTGLTITHFQGPYYSRNRPFDSAGIDEYDTIINRYLGRFKDCSPTFSISMSAGLDSRLVGAAAIRRDYPLSAFTIGEENSLETKMTADVCKLFNLPLKTHEVDGSTFPSWFNKTVWFTEGRVLPSHLHFMSAQFSGAVPNGPQLSGLVGEAVLGGHFDNRALLEASPQEIATGCRGLITSSLYWPDGARDAVLEKDLINRIPEIPKRIEEELFDRIKFEGSYSNYINFKNLLKGNSFMNPCILSQIVPWSDLINPFLDPEAFDLGASFSLDGIDARSGQIKWGERHLPDIVKLPRLKSGVVIDIHDSDPKAYERAMAKLIRKGKISYYLCRLSGGRINTPMRQSFPYYGSWYRRWRCVRDYVDGILLSDQTLDRGLFKREGMKTLLHDLQVGRRTWGVVGSCLMLEVFLRQFVDGTDIPEDPVTPLGFE